MKVTNDGRQEQIRLKLEREQKELEEDQFDGNKFAAEQASLSQIKTKIPDRRESKGSLRES